MTEKLEQMIEYQTLEVELRSIVQEFNNLELKKNFDKTKNMFEEKQSVFDKSVEQAETLDAEIESAYIEFNTVFDSFKSLETEYNKCKKEEDKAKFLPQFDDVRGKLESCKNKIAHNVDEIKNLNSLSMQALAEMKKIKEEYDKIKSELENVGKEYAPERERIKGEMGKLKPKLDSGLLEVYLKRKADVKLPVFVEVRGTGPKDYACLCGMQLSQTNKSELETKPYCQCETCRRLVYKK